MSFTSQLQKKSIATSQPIPLSTGMFASRSVQRQVEPEEDTVQMQRQVGMPDYASLVGNDPRNVVVQAKLTVGAPNDKYEQEADAMAARVMTMPDGAVQREGLPEEENVQQGEYVSNYFSVPDEFMDIKSGNSNKPPEVEQLISDSKSFLSCSFLDGQDPENDFWGTKGDPNDKESYQRGGVIDAAISTLWNAGSSIPGVGSAVSGISTGIDLLKMTASGAVSGFMSLESNAQKYLGMEHNQARRQAESYGKAAKRFWHDAQFDIAGLIPGLGTSIGIAATEYDATETLSRASGNKPNPLSSDIYHQIREQLENGNGS
jgi:hypothetical protein